MKKKILVIPHRGIGDVIFHVPLVKILNETSELNIISAKTNKSSYILENFKNTKVHYYDFSVKSILSKISFFFNFKNFLNSFDAEEIYFLGRSTYLLLPIFFCKIKYKKLYADSLMDSKKLRKKMNSTMPTELIKEFIKKNFNTPCPNFKLQLDNKRNIEVLKKYSHFKKPWIFFSVDSFHNAPNWDMKHYEEMILFSERNFKTIFVNTLKSNEFLIEKIKAKKDPNIVITSNFDWRDIMSLIYNCDLFIGNLSGPAHLADSFNKRTIVINNNLHKNSLWTMTSKTIGERSNYFNTWETDEKNIKNFIINEIEKKL